MEDAKGKVFIGDTGLAALLLTLKFELVDLERTSEKRVEFVFSVTDGIEKVISDFWQDKIVDVPTQTLFHNFRQLKNRLYSLKK